MLLVSELNLEGCPEPPLRKYKNPLQGVLGGLGSLGEEAFALCFSFGNRSL